jgi:hypothetical protein
MSFISRETFTGVLAISATDLNYRDSSGDLFGDNWPFQINPTYGGGAGTGNHDGVGHWYVGHMHVGGIN